MSEKTQGEILMEKLTFKRDNGCKDEKIVAEAELFCILK